MNVENYKSLVKCSIISNSESIFIRIKLSPGFGDTLQGAMIGNMISAKIKGHYTPLQIALSLAFYSGLKKSTSNIYIHLA